MADLIQNLGSLDEATLRLLAKMPVAPPPEGVTSNFVDPPSRAALHVWTTSVFLGVALIMYANRVYVKMRLMRAWSWDDVTLALTVLLVVAQYIVMTRGVTHSILGRHLWDISIAQMLNSKLPPLSYAMLILTPWTLLFLKSTFFLLYLHLFSRIRWVRISSWVGIGYVVISMGAIVIYTFAIANPHENVTWAEKATQLGLPVGVLSLVADLVIFVIPFAAIIPLQISPAKRLGALLIFLTGGCAVICSVLNIYYRHGLRHSPDPLWDGVLASIFALCEALIGITCACLPTVAYGFRQQGTLYNKALHPTMFFGSKRDSGVFTSSTQQRSGISGVESPVSKSRIRRTTYVEISTSASEHGPERRGLPSPVEEEPVEIRSHQAFELRTLEPAHMSHAAIQ